MVKAGGKACVAPAYGAAEMIPGAAERKQQLSGRLNSRGGGASETCQLTLFLSLFLLLIIIHIHIQHQTAVFRWCCSVGGLTEGCSHGRVLHGGLVVSGGQVRSGEVAALFVVVFDVEASEFGEADPQGAAAVVDVLSVQRLKHSSRRTGVRDEKKAAR